MKKTDAIIDLSEKLGTTKAESVVALETVLNLISESLVTGDKEFNITGWGKFEAVEKAARKGRNPKTGEEIDIAATTAVKFKVGSKLKAAVKAGEAYTL
jgi:DNA-binding protein HU-beta